MLSTYSVAMAVRKLDQLGSGLFATVRRVTPGKVIKVASDSDGTRNWLEFCAMRTAAGTLLPGMPHVDLVVPTTRTTYDDGSYTEGYVAIMNEYRVDRDLHTIIGRGGIQAACAEAIEEYLKYCATNFYLMDYREAFNDMHGGNVLFDKDNNPVITDPNSGEYRIPGAFNAWRPNPPEFKLEA